MQCDIRYTQSFNRRRTATYPIRTILQSAYSVVVFRTSFVRVLKFGPACLELDVGIGGQIGFLAFPQISHPFI